ncbi:MAG: hypothetical protein AAF736_00210 [Pseudomonadota bacterium]
MKTTMMLVLLACFGIQLAEAQPDRERNGERRGPPPHHRALEALNLSAEQRDAAEELFQSHRQQMRELRESGGSCEDHSLLKQQMDDDLQALLTPEQFSTLEKQRANRPARNGRRKGCEDGVTP